MQTPIFANGSDSHKLVSSTKMLYDFITKTMCDGHNFDSLSKELVIREVESIVGADDFSEQYRLLRAAMRNTDKFKNHHTFIYEHSEKISDLLSEASQEIKRKHPNEVRPEKTVMFSQVDTFISKTEVDDATTNGGEGSVFASSMIEGDAVKPKQNGSDYDKLKTDNEQLRTKNNLLSMLIESLKKEKNELMDKQVDLSAENGGLKAENNGLKERVVSLEHQNQLNLRDVEKLQSINDLYEQVVGIYQRLTRSNKDFEEIIRLMKQIEGKKGEK